MDRRKFISAFSIAVAVLLSTAAIQPGKKDTTVTIIVDTDAINQNNKDQMTEMYDDRGGSSTRGNHKDFVSLIDYDKRVIWMGEAKNGADQVRITRIEKKNVTGNKSLLKKDVYDGDGAIEAKVRKNGVVGDEAYNIYFSVIRNGQRSNYMIDPKMRINN